MNLDTLSYMREIKNAITRVINSDKNGTWSLISYVTPNNQVASKLCLLPINVIQQGDVWFDLLLSFEPDLILYAFVKLEDMSKIPESKTFLIHWIGENVSENMKSDCAPHLNEIRNLLPEYDLLISSMDVRDIQKKVMEFLSQTQSVISDNNDTKLRKTSTFTTKKSETSTKDISSSQSVKQRNKQQRTKEIESSEYRYSRYRTLAHFKVSIIGEHGVGKTGIYCCYRGGGAALESPHKMQPTVLNDQYKRHLTVGQQEMVLDIWDTAGHERFRSFAPCWLRNAHVVLLVYDITEMDSFSSITTWLSLGKQYAKTDAVFFLVGNKSDMGEQRVVPQEKANVFAEKNGMVFMECSGLTGFNILDLFDCVARRLLIAFSSIIEEHKHPHDSILEESNIIKLFSDSDTLHLYGKSQYSKKKCCSS